MRRILLWFQQIVRVRVVVPFRATAARSERVARLPGAGDNFSRRRRSGPSDTGGASPVKPFRDMVLTVVTFFQSGRAKLPYGCKKGRFDPNNPVPDRLKAPPGRRKKYGS